MEKHGDVNLGNLEHARDLRIAVPLQELEREDFSPAWIQAGERMPKAVRISTSSARARGDSGRGSLLDSCHTQSYRAMR